MGRGLFTLGVTIREKDEQMRWQYYDDSITAGRQRHEKKELYKSAYYDKGKKNSNNKHKVNAVG